MKSIKPGRGPSGMSFVGSIAAVVFGLFWTAIAFSITRYAGGIIHFVFPAFGVVFIGMGIVQAIYHYRNATGKDRYSLFDITDSSEEGDPAESWIRDRDDKRSYEKQDCGHFTNDKDYKYCPYCGEKLKSDFKFCPECGKDIRI